ncbi:MAG: epimerase [Bradymonadia bacterium]
MKIIIPGGSGQLGALLTRHFVARGDEVVVLSRRGHAPEGARGVEWDGRALGAWSDEIDGADVVINLAGRTVNCRPTAKNRQQMMTSRVNSTRAVGEAIAIAERPPGVWLQMSTATIYAHRHDAPNDEATGIIGGEEPDAPAWWASSIWVAQAWERTLAEAETPHTRKVALRAAMVMSADRGGVFDVLVNLTRLGLGGAIAGGKQFVSWIHGDDFVRAVQWCIDHPKVTGAINLCAPEPLPQRDFAKELRVAWGTPVGLPAMGWMVAIGAWCMRTDTELVRKSRRVVPGRLLEEGFEFVHRTWPQAAQALVAERKNDTRALPAPT